MRRIQIIVFIIISICTFQLAHAQPPIKNVLILHSYSVDFEWTNDSNNGIRATFQREAPDIHLRTEFMDTKNYYNQKHLASLAKLYKQKYTNAQPDGIIVMDNNALDFIETYGKKLFPNAIAVAAGINHAKPPQDNAYVRSIIAEDADHAGTIRQALKLWPKTKNIFVITDETPTGAAHLSEIKAAAKQFPNIYVSTVPALNEDELVKFVSTRQATDLICISPFFKSIDGKTYTQGEMEKKLANVATAPIISSWYTQLGTGVAGGRTISSSDQGKLAAQTLLKLLNNKEAKRFYGHSSTQRTIYDYSVLKRFHANLKQLPTDTVFLNKPVPFGKKHQSVLLPAAAIIAILVVITLLLNLNLQNQRKINRSHKLLLNLDQEVIDTQRELVTTLGEVIEVRSQETGNHVKRVSKISGMLGEKIGLDKAKVALLEAASPLHDVGKIGIPESILHKPGKLTKDEFEIIKTHTTIGKAILEGSNRELLRTACDIAYQHHERWDGTGYPNGLSGNAISIYARITTLADVYDALASERCYKKAWEEKRIFDYLQKERGKTFDPQLVDVFIENIATAQAIRVEFPNETSHALNHHSSPDGI